MVGPMTGAAVLSDRLFWRRLWQGWQDSNLRISVPKTNALPFGYTPALISPFLR